jgi:pimeloyl-ACP methyl ester carboxylesterase
MESAKFIDVDGIRTRYFDAGAGEATIVLIHGGEFRSSSNAGDWSSIWDLLAARFRVVAFDKLGQGFTDLPDSDDELTMSATVRHTLGFLEVLGIDNAVMVGHSRGALPAAYAAVHVPERVLAVIAVDSNTLAPDHPDYPKDFYPSIYAAKPEVPDEAFARLELERNSYATDHITPEIVASRLEAARLEKMEIGFAKMKTLYESQYVPDFKAVRRGVLDAIAEGALVDLPMSVIWGYDDPSAPLTIGYALLDRLAPHIDWTEFHIINQSGHYPYREHPEAAAGLMVDFVERALAGRW